LLPSVTAAASYSKRSVTALNSAGVSLKLKRDVEDCHFCMTESIIYPAINFTFEHFSKKAFVASAIKLLSELKRGQRAIIDSFNDYEASLKLLEMGCIPGEEIEVVRIAPLGDPMAIMVAGYQLSLRREEAAVMKVRVID
jgi:ferrous iron transport protein A